MYVGTQVHARNRISNILPCRLTVPRLAFHASTFPLGIFKVYARSLSDLG